VSVGRRIRVMVVDDHPVVRSGVKYALLAFDDIEVTAEASNGDEAIRLCDESQPDVVLMDMMMSGMDGVQTTCAIRERHPAVSVIVLTSFLEGDLVQSALQAGAIGYLLKDVDGDQLAGAIRSAADGQSTLAPAAAQALVRSTAIPKPPAYALTVRQRQVLALIVAGMSNAEIANRLVISLPTARFHVSAILTKLGASNRAEAAVVAVKYHLVEREAQD